MKPAFIVGVVLIVLGIIALVYQGIPYVKHNTIDLGPIHATAEEQKTLPLPPILGVISLVGGIVLVVTGSRK